MQYLFNRCSMPEKLVLAHLIGKLKRNFLLVNNNFYKSKFVALYLLLMMSQYELENSLLTIKQNKIILYLNTKRQNLR